MQCKASKPHWPESCGVPRKGDAEALTGESAGQAIESRKTHYSGRKPIAAMPSSKKPSAALILWRAKSANYLANDRRSPQATAQAYTFFAPQALQKSTSPDRPLPHFEQNAISPEAVVTLFELPAAAAAAA